MIGDPTEGCLLVAAQKAGFDLQTELIERPRIYELPFESVRKRMSVVHVEGDGQRAYVKGAPSETLSRCTRMRLDGDVVAMTDELRERVVAQNDEMSRQALRVLAVCERDLPHELTEYTPDTVETDLTFLGLVGMIDPPRPEVTEAVEHALTAGIRIIMVTGDYGLTAEAIARRIGIVRGDQQRARHHRRGPRGHDRGRPQGRAPEAAGRRLREGRTRAQDAGRERPQGAWGRSSPSPATA